MPTPLRPLPPTLGAAFTVAAAAAAGIPRSRTRGRDLAQPHRGVRTRHGAGQASLAPPPPDEPPFARNERLRAEVRARIDAYELVRRPHAFYTGRTAVALYDRLVEDETVIPRLDVAVLAPARAPRGRGIHGVQLGAGFASVRTVEGLPVASPASVWAGLAGELGERDLVRLGDAMVRIPRGPRGIPRPDARLATIAELAAAAAVPRRRGRIRLERALARVRVGSMSPLETDFRLDAAEAGLPEPELDVEIRDAKGRLLGIGDAVYRRARVIVEVEGRHHRTSDAQWERDIDRYAALVADGWEIVRLTGHRIRAGRAADVVAAALRRRDPGS